jgi:cytidylate kinase
MLSDVRIAISGKSGCGNTTVSSLVAQELGLTLINYTFRNMAQERGMEFKEFCGLAERDLSIDRMLDEKQVELASGGSCVLGSRLAIWVLKNADLKVYLKASSHVRAERIVRREGGDHGQVMADTADRDRRDRNRYLKLYGIDNDDFAFADLIIDTDRLESRAVADVIISAARSITRLPDLDGDKKYV